jgi:hypothetical protein
MNKEPETTTESGQLDETSHLFHHQRSHHALSYHHHHHHPSAAVGAGISAFTATQQQQTMNNDVPTVGIPNNNNNNNNNNSIAGNVSYHEPLVQRHHQHHHNTHQQQQQAQQQPQFHTHHLIHQQHQHQNPAAAAAAAAAIMSTPGIPSPSSAATLLSTYNAMQSGTDNTAQFHMFGSPHPVHHTHAMISHSQGQGAQQAHSHLLQRSPGPNPGSSNTLYTLPPHPIYATFQMTSQMSPPSAHHQHQFSSPMAPATPGNVSSANTSPGSASPNSVPQKRKINKLACEYCSKLHKKCDGDHPNPCTRCKQKGIACNYVQRRKRGPKTKRMKTGNGQYDGDASPSSSTPTKTSGIINAANTPSSPYCLKNENTIEQQHRAMQSTMLSNNDPASIMNDIPQQQAAGAQYNTFFLASMPFPFNTQQPIQQLPNMTFNHHTSSSSLEDQANLPMKQKISLNENEQSNPETEDNNTDVTSGASNRNRSADRMSLNSGDVSSSPSSKGASGYHVTNSEENILPMEGGLDDIPGSVFDDDGVKEKESHKQ